MEYDRRVIIKLLFNERCDATQIVERLKAQFHEGAYLLRSVQFWIGQIKRRWEELRDAQRFGRGLVESLMAQIKLLLDENCFVSARSIAETLQVSHSTVLKHLHEDLGFQSFHLRWVPHLLTPELKEQRRTDAYEMIAVLLSAQKDGWHHLVTGDESWFFLSYSLGRMWTLTRDDVVSKLRREIRTAKFMFTVMWDPRGFHMIDELPDGVTMNAHYFTENILGPFEEKIFPYGRAAHERRLVVHVDNAPVHNCGMATSFLANYNMVRLQHQPDSPDLTPSDFYLFQTVKEKLKDIEIVGGEDLFYRLQKLLYDIPIHELHTVFTEWIKRLVDVNKGDGSYIS